MFLSEKYLLIHFFDKYKGVITWSYDDLIWYNSSIIQYMIELVEGDKLVRKNRGWSTLSLNPLLLKN